jgi:hypothetical protein
MPKAARIVFIACAVLVLVFTGLALGVTPVDAAHAHETCCSDSDSTPLRGRCVVPVVKAGYYLPLEGEAVLPRLDAVARWQVAERLETPLRSRLLANLRV